MYAPFRFILSQSDAILNVCSACDHLNVLCFRSSRISWKRIAAECMHTLVFNQCLVGLCKLRYLAYEVALCAENNSPIAIFPNASERFGSADFPALLASSFCRLFTPLNTRSSCFLRLVGPSPCADGRMCPKHKLQCLILDRIPRNDLMLLVLLRHRK